MAFCAQLSAQGAYFRSAACPQIFSRSSANGHTIYDGLLARPRARVRLGTTRPATLRQCKDDCLREASKRFGVNAQYVQMWRGDKRRKVEMDEDERVTRDVMIQARGDPYESGYPEGGNIVRV